MGMGKWTSLGLALLLLWPFSAQAAPAPKDYTLKDAPNDDGSAIAVTWSWDGEPAEADTYNLQVRINQELVDHYKLTDQELTQLNDARAWLTEQVGDMIANRDAAAAEMAAADEALSLAIINKQSNREIAALRRDYWAKYQAHRRIDRRITALNEAFGARTWKQGKDLRLKALTWEYLQQALNSSEPWVDATGMVPMAAALTKAARPDLFGVNISNNEAEAARLFTLVNSISVPNPGTPAADDSSTGLDQFPSIPVNLVAGIEYQIRMLVHDGTAVPEMAVMAEESAAAEEVPLDEAAAAEVTDESAATESTEAALPPPALPPVALPPVDREYVLGMATPANNAFDLSKFNNLIFSLLFSAIILTFIILARRNPNMFIRRIAGLEAVDEAIGRATEMGKPVLYLCGMTTLSDLPTLAAINILGRVAGKIADYDSELIVPNRDPVVQTVAQEVVKEGYLNAGRPDAYREDNIFFLTDDQFSFTAATCGIMMREKPAAIFLMGYYYAESLLLAETGAETGAIQIAGTDSETQLPFFIVTCDYTLIGEELYAASAYLSREPMLLGSLKGQDVAKAFMLALILLQALLFIGHPTWDILKDLVTPL